jgi:hypothetical protein
MERDKRKKGIKKYFFIFCEALLEKNLTEKCQKIKLKEPQDVSRRCCRCPFAFLPSLGPRQRGIGVSAVTSS